MITRAGRRADSSTCASKTIRAKKWVESFRTSRWNRLPTTSHPKRKCWLTGRSAITKSRGLPGRFAWKGPYRHLSVSVFKMNRFKIQDKNRFKIQDKNRQHSRTE